MTIYLVVTESVVDYEKSASYMAFTNKNDAVQALKKRADVGCRVAEENEWEHTQSDTYFETYENGYFAQNHYTAELLELELLD